MTDNTIKRAACMIAAELGDDFDFAFENKTLWVRAAGMTANGFRDCNAPYKCDYIEAAKEAFAIFVAAK